MVTDPVLLDLPDQVESERLIIRGCLPGDGPAAHAAILESLEILRPWMTWAHPGITLEEVETGIRKAAAKWLTREDFRMQIYRKSDGLFVGGAGLHRINWQVPAMEIGYWVGQSCQGKARHRRHHPQSRRCPLVHLHYGQPACADAGRPASRRRR